MNVSLNWLTDYVDISMPAAQLGELLTAIGLNLESITETSTDLVLELEVTSDRPDLLCHIGIAREIAAATGAQLKLPELKRSAATESAGKIEKFITVEVADSQLCPRYTARVIRGVKVAMSPEWMVERLEAVGLRSINNIVDATNYVMYEYSQPLHSFDYDKLAGGKIVVRPAAPGEMLVSIDETKCKLDDAMLVIADSTKPVAIAGIMGGLETEVTDQTVNLLIEAAQFDPLTIRRTSRKLGLMSDSNYRFERGVDPVAIETASMRVCELIIELAGGELADGMADVWAKPYESPKVTLRPARASKVLGMEISAPRQMDILGKLELNPSATNGEIICTIPSHRADLRREADLIEEVGRMEGYDKIPLGSHVSHSITSEGLIEQTRRVVGQALAAAGFDEAITITFVDQVDAALFGFDKTVDVDAVSRRTNNALRPTVLPNLLRVAKTNQDLGNSDLHLFEISDVFVPAGEHDLPSEHIELGLLSTGDLRDLRGAIEAAMSEVDPTCKIQAAPAVIAGLAEGQSAQLTVNGKVVGLIGLIDPKVQDHFSLEKSIAAGAIRFDALLARAGKTRQYQPLAKTPSVQRDLSVIVDDAATWAQLVEVIDSVDQPIRTAVEYVTTYRGKPIEPGKKSVTIALTYHRLDATLRNEEVDEQIGQLVAAFSEKLNAELRK